jgi:hypothetical protein
MPLILEREELKKQMEKREREAAARREYIRKINALKSEIASLENQRAQYVNFKSSISSLSSSLSILSKNLGYASEYLAKGMSIDNVGVDAGEMEETSIQAKNYATKLANNNQLIEEKISNIESMIRVKQAELARLIG